MELPAAVLVVGLLVAMAVGLVACNKVVDIQLGATCAQCGKVLKEGFTLKGWAVGIDGTTWCSKRCTKRWASRQ